MLGGYGRLDRIDVLASRAFLKPFLRPDQTMACGNHEMAFMNRLWCWNWKSDQRIINSLV
jgi:hypothetical protein